MLACWSNWKKDLKFSGTMFSNSDENLHVMGLYRGHSKMKCASTALTPKWHRKYPLQHVFNFEFSFEEIDGYRCKSNHIKGGCSRVQQIASKICNRPFSFSINFLASNAPISIEQLAGFLRLFLASFLDTTNSTPNFTATSTKWTPHTSSPLHLKNCKNYETLLYLMQT